MRKLNPDIHIICGKCGCSTMFNFKLKLDSVEYDDRLYPCVFIYCGNCSTVTGLEEIIKDETDWDDLGLSKQI